MIFLLVGCLDPISNRLFFEDQEFLDALPSAEDDRVRYAESASQADTIPEPGDEVEPPAGAPLLLVLTVESVNDVNAMVDALLGIVDAVREVPPTSREEDARTWGPFPADNAPGYDVRMVSTRQGFGEFRWSFDTAPHGTSDWTTFFSGVHVAGATVRDGIGSFVFDGFRLDELHGSDETPFHLEVDYNHLEGSAVSFAVWLDASQVDGPALATWAYTIDPDDAGTFAFDTSDIEFSSGGGASGKPEDWHVTAHWIPDVGGRGDATVSGGDLGTGLDRQVHRVLASGRNARLSGRHLGVHPETHRDRG